MTAEEIEAEWWAYHYRDSKSTAEFDDDDENAATDYLAQITADAEAEEARAAVSAAENEGMQDPGDWGPAE